MGRYFCKQIWPFWLDNRDVQGCNEVGCCLGQETSLAPPCSNLRLFGSKCTVSKKVLMALLLLFGLPQWFGAWGIVPPCPHSLRPWWCSIKIVKFSENKQFSSPNVMNFYSMTICNFQTQYGMDLAQTANKGYWRHFRFLRVVLDRREPVFVC